MAMRGFSIDITDKVNSNQAITFSQWIGASNVMRNHKLTEYKSLLAAQKGSEINKAYSHIRKNKVLSFLKDIPVQLMRNAAQDIFEDVEKWRNGLVRFPRQKGRSRKRSIRITKEMFVLEPLGENRSLLTFFDNATQKRQRLFSIQLGYAPHQLCKQFRISRQGRHFYLSGSYNDGIDSPTNEELLKGFVQQNLSDEALLAQITGIDRGVKLPIATSDGLRKAYSPEKAERLRQLARKKARYQRILAAKKRRNGNKNVRRVESKEQQKLADKIANFDAKTARIPAPDFERSGASSQAHYRFGGLKVR